MNNQAKAIIASIVLLLIVCRAAFLIMPLPEQVTLQEKIDGAEDGLLSMYNTTCQSVAFFEDDTEIDPKAITNEQIETHLAGITLTDEAMERARIGIQSAARVCEIIAPTAQEIIKRRKNE